MIHRQSLSGGGERSSFERGGNNKSINTDLFSMEQALKAAHGASAGIDGMTASMVRGAAGISIVDVVTTCGYY